MNLAELKNKSVTELSNLASGMEIEGAGSMRRQELLLAILRIHERKAGELRSEGVLEILPDGFGFLRAADANYLPSPEDIYVSPSQIRRFNLQTGDALIGVVRAPKESERYFALLRVETVNGRGPDEQRNKPGFEELTAAYPNAPLNIDGGPSAVASRVLDLFVPIGKGQRCLLSAPPRGGASTLLRELAQNLGKNHPELQQTFVLIDARPEEVAETRRALPQALVWSTFEDPATRHVQLAEIAVERAKRIAENGGDAVVFVDSLSRLVRAYGHVVTSPCKLLPGGVPVSALLAPKRLFAAARRLEQGGSLTIIAAVATSGDDFDVTVANEFRGAANAEITLHPALCEQRLYPAIDLQRSATSRDELLRDPETLVRAARLRASLVAEEPAQGAAELKNRLSAQAKNADLLASA